MARRIDPFSGEMVDVDDAMAAVIDETWERLGYPAEPAPSVEVSAPEPAPRPRRNRKLIVPWQPAEIGRVRGGLPGRYQLTVDLGATLGLRQGEQFGCCLEDFDERMTTYRVRVQIKRVPGGLVFAPPKHERERSVPVPPDLRKLITAHIAAYGTVRVTLPWEPSGKPRTLTILFTGQHGRALDRSYINRLFRNALISAGIEPSRDVMSHMLRHIAASRWIAQKDADLVMVRDLLGHADLATTEAYINRLKTHDTRTRRVVARAQPKTPRRQPVNDPKVTYIDTWKSRRTS